MANVWHTCDSKSIGERRLADHLAALDDPKLHLFFSVGFIPGAREIDCLLVHEDIGAFIIEIKAIDLSGVVSVSPTEWRIKDRETKESPIMQAYRQYEGLRDYLKPHFPKLPFVAITVGLPKIKRRDWISAFESSPYARSLAPSLLFEEDFYSGLEVLKTQLRRVHEYPAARMGRDSWPIKDDFLKFLRKLLTPSVPLAPTQSEQERLRNIERGITREVQEAFPPGEKRHTVLSGKPGTGKTFRLLSIGAYHAYAGKRALFVCFNKTLASDIRRLLQLSEKLELTRYGIEVLDINQLALRCFETNGMAFINSSDADEWGELVVEQLASAESPIIQKFDTILGDEAQDLKAWQLDLLQLHSAEHSTVAIAIGAGQELYKDAASAAKWIAAFAERDQIKPVVLRRNFRNTREQYFFAEAFFDAWPDKLEKIEACRKRIYANRQQELAFERKGGGAPKYVSMPVNSAEFDNLGLNQVEIFSESVYSILREEFEQLCADPLLHPVGLLVLVPSHDGLHARACRSALGKLCSESGAVRFIDYTLEETRRASAAQDEIRLCTFHSARGLEGERVVVFGLEGLQRITDASGAKPENLGFVALSRGLFATTIAVRVTPRNSVHALCESILQCVHGI